MRMTYRAFIHLLHAAPSTSSKLGLHYGYEPGSVDSNLV